MSMKRRVKFYETERGDSPIREFLEGLEDRTLAKVLAVFKLVETESVIPAKFFQKFAGTEDLYEVRVEYRGQIYRFPAFWDQGALVILTHGFEKKSQKTPSKEIEKALTYKKDWQRRNP